MIRNLSQCITATLLFSTLVGLSGCTWKKASNPSILVITVEDFGFEATSCGSEDRSETATGVEILCSEAVRFTHAYTPSILSQPALASVLTGRYPQDHNVQNNGNSFLSARVETAPEIALASGFRTGYFGGGPPVWRNSGLNQGFEIFEDNIVPQLNALYRPASEVTRLFLEWRTTEAKRRPFFAVLHLADPQFQGVQTVTDMGETRPPGYRSQIEEIDETLGDLFRTLRKEKIWDDTNIIVVGLRGFATDVRLNETRETNLHSENTRVSFFIKPARKFRESSFNWKIDSNVSLVDVGATLFDLLGKPIPETLPPTTSLRSTFESPQPVWSDARLIMSQTDWANWKGVGRRRTAIRRGPFLYLVDSQPRIFNTLTDNLETSPIPKNDLRYAEIAAPFEHFVRDQKIIPFDRIEPAILSKASLGEEIWQGPRITEDQLVELRELSKRYPMDIQLQNWRAVLALKTQNWQELREAGKLAVQNIWTYVADTNRGVDTIAPSNPCLKFFTDKPRSARPPSLRECSRPELGELFIWTDEKRSSQVRQAAMDRFVRYYTQTRIDQKIAELNYATGLAWDLPMTKPESPSLTDLILALPDYARFKQGLAKRLGEN